MSGSPVRHPRVVVGIMAHDRPDLVRPLIERLAGDEITVCLHVDARSPFAIDAFLPDDTTHLVVVEPRVAARWGAPSLIDATIALMRASRRLRPEYFCLVSQSCTPTRTSAEIVERLCDSGAPGFLHVEPLKSGWARRIDQFHVTRPLPASVQHNLTRVRVRLPRRRRSRLPTPYGGSAWIDLRLDALDWLLDRIDADPGYRRAFAFTVATDEIFFHTLLMDSPFRDDLVKVHEADQHLLGLRYIRWDGGPHPQILTDADLDAARRLDCLFARKLD